MTSPKDIAEAFGACFGNLYADSDSSSLRNENKDFFSKIHDRGGGTGYDKTSN